MKNKGLTLIELVTALVIFGIIGLAITVHFVAEYRFRSAAQDRIAIIREAGIAVDHMTRVLRFAIPNTIGVSPFEDDAETTRLVGAVIERGHVDIVGSGDPDNIEYEYDRDTHAIIYRQGGIVATLDGIVKNVTAFNVLWNPEPQPEFLIRLTVSSDDGLILIPLETKIRVLGED